MEYFYYLISTYKYFILLPIAVVEGPIITIIASFLASLHVLNIYVVYGIAVMGDLIGDTIYYWLGRAGSHSFIPKYGPYIGVTEKRIKYVENHYDKHLGKTILFGKITQAPIAVILVVAGMTKVDFWKYMGIIFLVTIPKVFVFTILGYYFGASYVAINRYFDNSVLLISLLLILVTIIYCVIKYLRKKNKK